MVKATSIDMTLSDIISSNKKYKKGVKRPIKKSSAGIKKRGAAPFRRQSGGGGAVRRVGSFTRVSAGGNEKRLVRINVSNLAKTVMSSDLRELFGEFNLRKVTVNFNEDGTPVGTGDITLSKYDADRLIQKFAGVALDEKIMHFTVIETRGFRKPEVRGTPNRRNLIEKRENKVGKSSRNQKTTKPPTRKAKKPKREQKPHKTAEELDAELDLYMSRSA